MKCSILEKRYFETGAEEGAYRLVFSIFFLSCHYGFVSLSVFRFVSFLFFSLSLFFFFLLLLNLVEFDLMKGLIRSLNLQKGESFNSRRASR